MVIQFIGLFSIDALFTGSKLRIRESSFENLKFSDGKPERKPMRVANEGEVNPS